MTVQPASQVKTPKRVLVIGQGGREHAIVRQLQLTKGIERVFVAPGSDGIIGEYTGRSPSPVEACQVPLEPPFAELIRIVRAHGIDLVFVGPEQPLADGIADYLRKEKIAVFAPSKEGAKLEASKIHAKEVMRAAGVRTARSFVVTSVAECLKAAAEFAPPYVLKADGLAAGKGVFIEKDLVGLERSARSLFEEDALGDAGKTALLEEFSPGIEVSHLVLTNGKDFVSMPSARDHKRLLEGDEGPNTGGMGAVAPVPLADGLLETIERDVVAPVIAEIAKRGIVFRGVLYFGLMITPEGPSVLEFNTRFGDPEAQVLLPMLDESGGMNWGLVFNQVARGELPKLSWNSRRHVACLVLAAEGYPEQPKRGVKIEGLRPNGTIIPEGIRKTSYSATGDFYVLHASTRRTMDGRAFETAGGRVLNVVALSDKSMSEALSLAYSVAEKLNWPGRQIRRDIGATAKD